MSESPASFDKKIPRKKEVAQLNKAGRPTEAVQLKISEARLAGIIEAASDAIITLDSQQRVIVFNRAAEQMFGRQASQIIGQPLDQLLPTRFHQSHRHHIENFAKTGVTSRTMHMPLTNLVGLRANGEEFPIEATISQLEVEGQKLFTAIVRDVSGRRQMEAQLKASQQQFQASQTRLAGIISAATDAIITIDHQERIVVFNSAAEKLFVCPADQALGQPLDRFIPPRFRQLHTTHIQNFERTGTTARSMGTLSTLSALKTTGEEFPIEATISQVEVEGQKLFTVMIRDISERQKAEESLRESQERFQNAFEFSAMSMALVDLDGRYLQVNQAFCQLLGYSEDELLQTTFQAVTHPADLHIEFQLIKQLLTNQAAFCAIEKRYLHKNDAVIWVHSTRSLVRDSQGQPRYFISQLQDITERKRAEQALRLSEARMAGIIRSATDAIITLNAQQRIVVFNHAAEQMFGWEASQVLGQTLDNFIPQSLRQLHAQHIRNFAKTGVSVRSMASPFSKLTALRASGEEFPIEATISQLEAEGQKFFTVIIRDISEREKAEKALHDKEEQLRQSQKMEAVGQLAGGVAHDFNNLLTVIVNYSEIIARGPTNLAQIQESTEQIQVAAVRAASLTRQLLAFSRQQILQPQLVSLDSVVNNTLKMIERLIGEDIELVVNLSLTPSSTPAQLWIDPLQIEQAILNLAINARDAMPRGGKLIIETGQTTLDEAYLSSTHLPARPGIYAVLSVSDTGVGMDEATKTHIFEPFFTTKEKGKGTGLGLATVYGIVEQNKGTIWLYSEVGVGTNFKLYFPVVHSPQTVTPAIPKSQPELAEETLKGSETILLVEDEKQLRMLTRQLLEEQGYNVIEAQNGVEALEYIERYSGPIDLVLSDVVMPKMGGRELAAKVGRLRPQIRFLYMSGYTGWGSSSESEKAFLAPAANFLEKPFSAKTLHTKIREVLNPKPASSA
jgi:PAS domain S-box-containing protein